MKRGKDDEKIAGPMFPRLHVNDTEKGGPRAPPRNKMALYEQLSIPSQRFNSGLLPPNPNSTSNSSPKPSSGQVGGHERGTFFPLQLPPSVHPVEKMNSHLSDVNSQLVQQEQRKKQEEDDFRVPIFVQSGISQDGHGNDHSRDKEGHAPDPTQAPVSSTHTSRLVKHRNANERDPKQTDATDLNNSRQEDFSQSEDNSQDFVAGLEHSAKSASNQSFRQDTRDSLKQTNTFSSFGQRNYASKSYSHLQSNGNMQLDYGVESQRDGTVWGDSVSSEAIRVIEARREMLRSPNDPISCDAVSETSMVDSVAGIDISPDDVVGIIGQKHFWKARRAIVNQQRVFAVQVFELHRLIKVQKLIAESPQLLVEERSYLKPLKVSPAKKLPLEYIVKLTSNISKHKDGCEKPNQNMEFSSDNAVEKASLSSVQNGSQPSNYKPIPGNTQPTADPKMGPWSFNQQPGHQWLIPVMTPSEGLVYKPYPGPGFMSPVCGPGSTPMMGHNFVNYGIPPSHHPYQGLGLPPFTPPPSHGYFPPYGMPQMNPSISSSAGEHMHHFNMQYQSSNVPNEKNGAARPDVGKIHASKESEVQVSTASSPSERTRGRNALPLFPTSPVDQFPDRVPDQSRDAEPPSRVIRAVPHNARSATESAEPRDAELPSRVIRVVPHNARSATESVARIFQSIQEERKQHDSV